jgi:hypothetical protein
MWFFTCVSQSCSVRRALELSEILLQQLCDGRVGLRVLALGDLAYEAHLDYLGVPLGGGACRDDLDQLVALLRDGAVPA